MARFRRLPNGFGSVVKLSGKRRYPYNARTPVSAYTEDGLPICQSLGCFSTRQQAIDCLVRWHEENGKVSYNSKKTLQQVYKLFCEEDAKSVKKLSDKSIKNREYCFRALKPLHNRPISSIALKELQDVIDNSNKKTKSSRSILISYTRVIFKHAMKHGILEKDISQYLENRAISTTNTENKFYTMEELKTLKDNICDEEARLVLMMCYTGFRPSAYKDLKYDNKEKLYIGGIKTENSKDRSVPLKKELQDYAEEVFVPYTTMRNLFVRVNERYGLRMLTPHACRHTFKYLCDMAEVDDITCRKLMGHVLGSDVHSAVYSHRSIEDLREAIDKLEW